MYNIFSYILFNIFNWRYIYQIYSRKEITRLFRGGELTACKIKPVLFLYVCLLAATKYYPRERRNRWYNVQLFIMKIGKEYILWTAANLKVLELFNLFVLFCSNQSEQKIGLDQKHIVIFLTSWTKKNIIIFLLGYLLLLKRYKYFLMLKITYLYIVLTLFLFLRLFLIIILYNRLVFERWFSRSKYVCVVFFV